MADVGSSGSRSGPWRLWLLIAGNLLLVWAPLLFLSRFASDFELLAGRFHPLLVHLPIGVMLAALGLELFRRLRGPDTLRSAVDLLLYAGAWTALVACVTGLLLFRGGGYDAATLAWHRALGIGIATLASIAWWMYAAREEKPDIRPALSGVFVMTFLLIVVGGHLGGRLTHPEGFLTRYLPDPIRTAFGLPPASEVGKLVVEDPATTTVYDGIVRPILDRRCAACHNPETSRGGLSMATHESLLEGGNDGDAVVPGAPEESPMIQRIWLPPNDEDHMPPRDRPQITVAEAEILKWWIENGASADETIEEMEAPVALLAIFEAYGLGERKTGIFALDLPMPDTSAISRARTAGLQIAFLSQDTPFIEVRCGSLGGCLSASQIAELEPVLEYVAHFDAAGSELSPSAFEAIARFPHLVHSRLERTNISDDDLAALAGLEYLEVLNLYGTAVTDTGLTVLAALPALRRVYAWQSSVTEEGVEAFRQSRPGVEVNLGSLAGGETE